MLVAGLNLEWPENIRNFFNALTFVSSATNDVMQVSCLLKSYDIQSFAISVSSLSLILLALIPFFFGLCALTVWKIISVFKPHIR